MLGSHHRLLCAGLALVAACANQPTGISAAPASWTVSPPSLDLMVGTTAILTVTIFDARGDTLDAGRSGGWTVAAGSQLSCAGNSCPLEIVSLDEATSNPQRFRVEAHAVAIDSARFVIGAYEGCPDPPECLLKHWADWLPPLSVPITAHATR